MSLLPDNSGPPLNVITTLNLAPTTPSAGTAVDAGSLLSPVGSGSNPTPIALDAKTAALWLAIAFGVIYLLRRNP